MSYANMAELALTAGRQPTKQEWKTWVRTAPMPLGLYEVPAGFCTDFASIPRLLRWLYSSNSAPWQRAAVLHDYLYSTLNVTRLAADKQYYWQSRRDGTPEIAARMQYVALRLFGGTAFRKNRKRRSADHYWRFLW